MTEKCDFCHQPYTDERYDEDGDRICSECDAVILGLIFRASAWADYAESATKANER